MTEPDGRTLIETEQRSKTNSHRIDSLEKEIEIIKTDQKAIYKIATSVEVIAERVSHIEEKVDETSEKLDAQGKALQETEQKLSERMSDNEHKPDHELASNVNHIKLAVITAILTATATGLLGAIIQLVK